MLPPPLSFLLSLPPPRHEETQRQRLASERAWASSATGRTLVWTSSLQSEKWICGLGPAPRRWCFIAAPDTFLHLQSPLTPDPCLPLIRSLVIPFRLTWMTRDNLRVRP